MRKWTEAIMLNGRLKTALQVLAAIANPIIIGSVVYLVLMPACDAQSEGEIALVGQKLKTCSSGKWAPLHSERELIQR